MNLQLSDRVVIAAPTQGHAPFAGKIGTIGAAYRTAKGAKTYAVSLVCPRQGAQVVIFSENELELAPESNATAQTSPAPLSVPLASQSPRIGRARRCQRCGGTPPALPDVTRCMHWVGGRRCGGAMEAI